MARTRVGLLFGGRSVEHEVSVRSATNIAAALDRSKYEVIPIGIAPSGVWLVPTRPEQFFEAGMVRAEDGTVVVPVRDGDAVAIRALDGAVLAHIDVMFPIVHGTNGEDGTLQGLLELLQVPYVGAGVVGSAVGMDKDVMKRLLKEATIPIAAFRTLRSHEAWQPRVESLARELGLPAFVKPANLGSSVGVRKAKTIDELREAVAFAFQFDTKVIIEEAVVGREIECSVLGNGTLQASVPGEVIPTHDFYSYEAKYLDDNGAVLEMPAKLDAATIERVQELAKQTFVVLECSGLARVDFFLREDGELLVNEINTLPGFTNISMYPKLFALSGVAYAALLDRLLELAFERHREREVLQTSRLA